MKKRSITSRLFTNKRVGTMGLRARWLFAACIANADDDGRVEGEAALLRAMAFPHDDGMTLQAIDDALAECTSGDALIVAYDVNGERYLWLPGFERQQTLRYRSASRLPAPPDAALKKHRRAKSEEGSSPGARSEKQKRVDAEQERRERWAQLRIEALRAARDKCGKRARALFERMAHERCAANGVDVDAPLGKQTFDITLLDIFDEERVHFPPYDEWSE